MADREHRVADSHALRVRQRQRAQRSDAAGVDAQHGQVRRGVGAEHLRVDLLAAVAEAHLCGLGAGDDVRVRDDRAVLADDEAGAARRTRLDLDDTRSGGVEDASVLGGGEPAAACGWEDVALGAAVVEHRDRRERERHQRDGEARRREEAPPQPRPRRRRGSLRLGRLRVARAGLVRLPAPACRGVRSRLGVAGALGIDPEARLATHGGDATGAASPAHNAELLDGVGRRRSAVVGV